MRGAKEGIIVAGGNGREGKASEFSRPCEFIVDQWETIYVTDLENDHVIR